MRQQVNLLVDGFEKQKLAFSANSIALLCGAMVLVLALCSAGLAWRASSVRSEVARLDSDKVALGGSLDELQAKLEATKADPALEANLARLERNVRSREKLISLLGSSSGGNMDGFSAYMRGLAKYPVPGVWLTNIGLAMGGQEIGFSGVTTRPENLPSFLQNIGQEPVFRGRSFESFEISTVSDQADSDQADAGGHLEFTISTTVAGQEDRSGGQP